MTEKNIEKIVIDALEELKAEEIVSLDVRGLTTITDFMIICSGRSTRHAASIADNVVVRAKENGFPALGIEGKNTAEWILIDLGEAVVHVMMPETRAFYELEKLWGHEAVNAD